MGAGKTIITEDGEEINLTHLERGSGSYQFEGKACYATRQMGFTSRGSPGCSEEAEEGEGYVSGYSAPGYGENGNPVETFMMSTEIKGEEVDPENLNWSQDAGRVEAR